MSSLLPSLQAADLREALTSYLATTFALTDDDVRRGLQAFLTDPEQGIFRGPYVRLRLPFRPASGAWSVPLDWHPPGFTPYGHQAVAFERLSSKHHPPMPTLVTTGTGSGKTESFLIPILDHVLRARRAGRTGIKSLILYPMNALANDQALRLATLLRDDPRLAGVTAGLYTGEQGSIRTVVSADGLITDRAVMQSAPPDILLTNYKMLDQLLLRPADYPLWRGSRESLQYLVLDEFHTYDGAQGTDVAMLLRRLGLALGVARPDRPLGDLTPVATSATLGAGDPKAMLEFAATVFGVSLDESAIIAEERISAEDWFAERARTDQPGNRNRPAERWQLRDVAAAVRAARTPRDACAAVVRGLVLDQPRHGLHVNELTDREAHQLLDEIGSGGDLVGLIAQHPLTRGILEHAATPIALRDLAAALLVDDLSADRVDGMLVLDAYLGLLSLIRAGVPDGRRFLSTDVQLWIREVSRVERVADVDARFRWSDDGVDTSGELHLPAIYCRHCGRSGWSVLAAPTGHTVEVDAAAIRRESVRDAAAASRVRNLIYAGSEAAAAEDVNGIAGLAWFDTVNRELLATRPAQDAQPVDEAPVLPVLVNVGDAPRDRCPACERSDGIRYLGTGVATLASVSLSSLFAAEQLDRAEKKTLMFTDSVQDAAHRAGFVQARSHTLGLRGAMRRAIGTRDLTLPQVTEQMLAQAGDDPFRRFTLVPPALVERSSYRAFFERDAPAEAERRSHALVRRWLAFDVAREFGLDSRTGRTLELTGSVAAQVETGSSDRVRRVGSAALGRAQTQPLSPELDGAWATRAGDRLTGWVRGVLERIRTQGGIAHPWLATYLEEDGGRWQIWGGRPDGMPAFPNTRAAPSYPTSAASSELLNAIGSPQSWYARWAQRCLGVTPRDGAMLTRALLDTMVDERLLTAVTSRASHRIWALPPERVVVIGTAADVAPPRLRCLVCQTAVPGTAQVIDELDGAPCLRIGCTGELARDTYEADYYRRLYASQDTRRVVAAEHTSLLPDDVRLDREEAFKRDQRPVDPNVLVATPTLELGIDIGDLSTVMLSSLPRSVAAYQQRVGRAGRQTGNALVLAYVPGRGTNLPRWAEPLSLLDGEVRPPATYLDAVEILQRQYVAYLIDRRAADPAGPRTPGQARTVLATWEPGSWTGELLTDARQHARAHVSTFLDQFGGRVREDTAADLRAWCGADATDDSLDDPTGLELLFHRAVRGYHDERTEIDDRIRSGREALAELEERISQPAATDEDRIQHRTTRAELGALRRRTKELETQHWIQALEERGVLPNYTLLDDTVTLDVAVRWVDEDSGEYRDEPRTYQRGSRMALTEFAPGSTFYAQGVAARIDAVELATGGTDQVQSWTLCPHCGWGATLAVAPAQCPRCGDPGVQDTGQRLNVLPLERVSAQVSRDDASISDAHDDRERVQFNLVTAADVDPTHITSAWYLDGFPFGAEYIRSIDIRWLNLGRARVSGRDRTIAGFEVQTPLFRVCPGCGVVPAAQRRDEAAARHRGWCSQRSELDIDWREVALGRTLRTQAVRLLVPPQYTTDLFAAVSFRAALLVGLRSVLGGDPDHLDVVDVHAPVGGVDRVALLLHDTVPGGTGYLADFARPDRVRELLQAALAVIADCPCAGEGKLACHRCLLPFVAPSQVDRASRARATQILGEILGEGEWLPVRAQSIADVAPPSPESHLEQRFRSVFGAALRAGGAAVREQPLPEGTLVDFTVVGRHWTLRPQVAKGFAKPDFVLTTQDTAIPEVCIFTDGAAFHASAASNVVRDDARKRRGLRDEGCVVWAITSADLDRFEKLAEGQPVPALGPLTLGALEQVRRRQLAGAAPVELLSSDAVTQLMNWVQTPDRSAWERLASRAAMAFGALPGIRPRTATAGATAAVAAAALDQPAGFSGSATGLPGWTWIDHGALAVDVNVVSEDPLAFEVAAVLDDRTDTLVTDDGQQAWRDWLRLGNVLGFSEQAMTLATVREIQAGASVVADRPAVGVISLGPPWKPLYDGAVSDAERTALIALAEAGVPVPEQGYEDDAGAQYDLAWPTMRVAVTEAVDDASPPGWLIIGLNEPNAIARTIAVLDEKRRV